MLTILLNAFGLFLIILVGFFIKQLGLVKKADGKVLATIIVTITLPATIVIGMNSMEINQDFLVLASIAIVMNFALVLIGQLLWRKHIFLERALMMYSISGYNIGNFTLPFVQSFFPLAIPFLFMFDVGNCLMIAGGTQILVARINPNSLKKLSLSVIVKTLLGSLPFLTYLVMVGLRSLQLSLPVAVIEIIELFARGNGFLSLLMIGIYLELRLPKSERKAVGGILFWRYTLATLCALFFYFIVPFQTPLIKIVVTLVCFAPIPTFAVINSVAAGVKEEITGYLSSMSILISLVLMTLIILLIA